MFVFKVLFVRPPLDLPAEFSVWESDYFSKGVDHAKDSIRQSGELLYSEGYCPDGLASVYLDGETRSCDLGKITHGLREHAVRAFYALGTRLGDARVILPPSFGRHLGMSPGRHPLEEMRWVDVSSHLPGSGQDAGDWPDSGDAYDSDDVPFQALVVLRGRPQSVFHGNPATHLSMTNVAAYDGATSVRDITWDGGRPTRVVDRVGPRVDGVVQLSWNAEKRPFQALGADGDGGTLYQLSYTFEGERLVGVQTEQWEHKWIRPWNWEGNQLVGLSAEDATFSVGLTRCPSPAKTPTSTPPT